MNRTPPQRHRFTTDDGATLNYLEWQSCASEPAGTCLLLHGFTNDACLWLGLAPKLQQNYRVIALDFRGHGDSDWSDKSCYNHPRLMEDLQQFLLHLGLDNYHLIGFSLGARVGIIHHMTYQPNLLSFTLIDTGPVVGDAGANRIRIDAESSNIRFHSVEEYRQGLEMMYFLGAPERVRWMAENGLKRHPDGGYVPKTDPVFTQALWNTDAPEEERKGLVAPMEEELWQGLKGLHMPTLIVRGKMSAILNRDTAQTMVDEILPNGRLEVIPKAGHAVMIDNPPAFEDAVMTFIDTF